MQAYSPALPIGTQHAYRSSFHALSSVVSHEGWGGLTRGVGSAMLRTAMVSRLGALVTNGHLKLTVIDPARYTGLKCPATFVQLCKDKVGSEWLDGGK